MNELDRKILTTIKALMLGYELQYNEDTYVLSRDRSLCIKKSKNDLRQIYSACSSLKYIELLVKNLSKEQFFEIATFVVMNDKK